MALACFALIKTFAYDIVRVNNKDMLATYNYGDAVLIQKSFNKYNTNDVIYFQHPASDTGVTATYMFQRIFGLPGDSFSVNNKQVFLNGLQIEMPGTIKHNYYVKTRRALDSAYRHTNNLLEGGAISGSLDYSFSLTEAQVAVLKSDSNVTSLEIKGEKKFGNDESCFPASTLFPWNSDFYGPIYIPKKNDTLKLDTTVLKIYQSIISQYEKNNLRINHDSIFINENYCQTYVVKKDYYFVLGDNRGNANDSRNWGFLPDNFIVGKAIQTIRKVK